MTSIGVNVIRISLICLALVCATANAQSDPADTLVGRIEGNSYVSPTSSFRVTIPVLPELGGQVVDTDNVHWLLPLPWLLAGLAGLLAAVGGNRRRRERRRQANQAYDAAEGDPR